MLPTRKLFILLLAILSTLKLFAQLPDEELAAQYLGNQEYNKAADMYEKLLSKTPRSFYYYDNLLRCYFGNKDYESAQKTVKKLSKKFDQNLYYQVDLGYIAKQQQQEDKSKSIYESLIQKLKPVYTQINELAMAFQKRDEKYYAIEAFLKGRKLFNNEILFAGELGGLYAETNQVKNMIDEYLNVLVGDETQLQEVQGFFQNFLKENADFELLKQSLIKKNRQYPERATFPEMLIWLHVQRNEYDNALIYAKALDKRHKEDGKRLVDLGFLAIANGKYDAAITIFKQVESYGKDKAFYTLAKNSEVEARAKKLLTGNYTQLDLKTLENEYLLLLQEFGRNETMAHTMKDLAHLLAFYENNFEQAIIQYQEIINMLRADRYLKAQCKLELGDLYVLKNEVWDAMLLYGQVDKDFLEEPIGQEAKLRNAQLSYYIGEFEWAKAQLDVLKTATTQLIANNALELSLLIQDNTVDSNESALNIFARADLNFHQNKTDVALQLLDSIHLLFPKHELSDDIAFKKAEIFFKQKDYLKAASFYKIVVDEYGSDILGDNALYQLARLNQYQLNNLEEAKKLYEKFITDYPGSFFLTACRIQYRLLRGDQLN
ncbi:MAG: tetratricopeptide repeat protein [Bacteroidia bacterium]|nr:tetratricopeptide repeat protein [Bacteroidia bacterium]